MTSTMTLPETVRTAGLSVVSGALPALPLGRVVSALTEVGVDSIELTVGPGGHLVPGNRTSIIEAMACLRDSGLHLCGIDAPGGWPLGSHRLVEMLEIAATMRAPFLRVYPPPFDPSASLAVQRTTAARALHRLSESAGGAVMTLLEPAPGSVAPSPELARQIVLASAAPDAGVIFDPGSMIAEGWLAPALALEILGPLVRHVHVKNRALTCRNGRWRSEPRGLADGVVDWVTTLRALHRRGYAGRLSIDHLSAAPESGALRRDVAELRRLIELAHTADTPRDAPTP